MTISEKLRFAVGVASATSVFALSTGCATRLAPAVQIVDPCLRVRVGLDIGSGSSKARSAVVDVCHQRLVSEIARGDQAIGFKDHLSTRPEADKNFSPDFLTESEARIAAMVASVREQTARKLRADSSLAPLASLEVEVAGVATEAFRQAGNTSDFKAHLKQKHNISLNPIDQMKEGHLGFIGVISSLGLASPAVSVDPDKIVSWDVGGGSLQMVAYQKPGQWLDFGNRLASNPMRVFILKNVKKISAFDQNRIMVSPNPIISPEWTEPRRRRETEKLMGLVRQHVEKEMKGLIQAGWLSAKALKASGRAVYGVGGVHNGIIRFLRQLTGEARLQGITRPLLEKALRKVLELNDERLVSEYHARPEYASVLVTNLLLVKSVMDVIDLDRVTVLDVDNTYGVLVSSEFWSDRVKTAPLAW